MGEKNVGINIDQIGYSQLLTHLDTKTNTKNFLTKQKFILHLAENWNPCHLMARRSGIKQKKDKNNGGQFVYIS